MGKEKRVFDCFTFFNEFDLLEIRLKYLYDHVDHFIIVESDTTHNGEKKPFHFKEQKERYAQYQDKITYIASEMPAFKSTKKVAWKRENYQRDEIKKGLEHLRVTSEDLILLSDLDEIVKSEVVDALRRDDFERLTSRGKGFLVKEVIGGFFGQFKDAFQGVFDNKLRMKQGLKGLSIYNQMPILLQMDNYYYYMNNREKQRNIWKGTISLHFDILHDFTLSELRELRRFPVKSIKASGWHFSYLGGIEKVKHKLRSFAHQEYNVEELVNDDYIKFCIENGYSLFTYFNNKTIPPQFERVDVDEFPETFRNIVINYPDLFYK